MHTYIITYYIETATPGKVEMKSVSNWLGNSKAHAKGLLAKYAVGFAGVQSIIQTH